MKSLLLVVAACVVVGALPVAMAQLDVPGDVLQDAVRQAYMSSPKRSPTLANMLNRATSSVLPTRDIGARMLAEAASPTASPWYKTGVTDGPPCPQNLPLSPQITAADVQSAIAAVQAMGEAALKAANGPPGLHINVVYGDTVLLSQGFGTTNVNFTGTAPVTDDTIFRIGSNTKVFMTLTLHRLAELGIVGIDDPLEKYVPEFQFSDPYAAGGPITLHQLATFQAGLQREGCVCSPTTKQCGCGLLIGDNATAVFDAMKHTASVFPRNSPTPIYSNFQIQLLGRALDAAIERADVTRDGEAFSYTGLYDYLENGLFQELGFTGSGFNYTQDIIDRCAWSDQSPLNDYCRFMYFGFTTPSGGMYMSGHDMAKWASYLLSGTNGTAAGRILQADTLRAFVRPVTPFAAGTSGFGFSTFCAYMAGTWVMTKGGAVPGYQSGILVAPDLNLGITVMTSSGNFDASTITVPALNTLAPAIREALASKAKAAADTVYSGSYTSSELNITVLINATSVGLTLALSTAPDVTGALIPTGFDHHFFLVPNSQTGCYLALAEVTAVAGGTAGQEITSADMVWFNVDNATGLATTLVQPYKDVVLART